MKKILFIALIGLFVSFAGISMAQEIGKRPLQNVQQSDAIKGITADIVQVLPGGKIIERADINNKTVLYSSDQDGNRTKIYEGNRSDYFSHSQNGKRICFKSGPEFIVKDLETSEEFRFPTAEQAYLNGFANISPDGNEIVFMKSNRTSRGGNINDEKLVVRNLATNKERVIGNGGWPIWSPDSTRIVFSRIEGSIGHWRQYLWLVNSDGTGARKLVNSVYLSGAGIQWSPNGKYVMDSDRQGNLRIVDVNKGEAVIISPSRFGNVSGASKEFTQVSWSPDGKTILVGIIVINNVTEETIGKELYLISVDGTRIERLDIPGLDRHFPIWLGADELLFRDSRRGSIWNKAILRRAEQ